jgi:hypothetical protein
MKLLITFSFSLLPFLPIVVQIFSSPTCSKLPSVFVPPLMFETKFHTHAKLQACHYGMARTQVADGGDGLRIWRIATKIFYKRSWTADEE